MIRRRALWVALATAAMVMAIIPAASAGAPGDQAGLVDPVTGIWLVNESLSADLTGAAEVPGPGDSNATGTASMNLDGDTGDVCFSIAQKHVNGTIVGAHIHEGAAGVAGPVVISLDWAGTGGTGCVTAPTDVIDAVNADPAGYYVNVHSTVYPAGAIRGQLAAGSRSFYYGDPTDNPFQGDWDCDGVDTPGLHRPSDGKVYLRNSNNQGIADIEFFFGNPDDVPLPGDFDGDGCDSVSLYRPSTGTVYIINEIGSGGAGLGSADFSFAWGDSGDNVIAGDWDGNGIDDIGAHDPATAMIELRMSLDSGPADVTYNFGDAGDVPFSGDFDGDGDDTVGVFRPGNSTLYIRNSTTSGPASASSVAGESDWRPIAGALVPLQHVDVQLLAFNDYHGHLEATTPGTVDGVPAGGGEYLSAKLAELRAGHTNTLTVAAGDLIGGSPAFSGLFHDEPSVESLNVMGLDVSSVGNHEFDEGVTELLRMQDGGCHPVDGCYFAGDPYAGADFQWLAANTVSDTTGETPLPPYWVEEFDGVKVGFIGMTLEATDTLVAAAGIDGWSFLDEVETANALVPELTALGAQAIVVLLHEGGSQTPPPGAIDACVGISGPIVTINDALDPEIDVLITGHTHLPYNCWLDDSAGNPRIVTSAYSYGRVVSEINLKIDRDSKDVWREASTSTNHLVEQAALTADPAVTAVLDKWAPLVSAAGDTPIGSITADINRGGTPPGDDRGVESPAGNLVADAQLWATSANGAEVALMNPGGVRSDLIYAESAGEGDGVVTFAEAFTFQPFGNTLKTFPMTGAQLVDVLEEQCQPAGSSRAFLHLGVSDGLTYDLEKTVDGGGDCTSVTISNVELNGFAVGPTDTIIVTVNSFLSDGGDNFDTFATIDDAAKLDGGVDLEALTNYLGTFGPVAPPSTDRVNELN